MSSCNSIKQYSWIDAKIYCRLSSDHSHVRFFMNGRSFSIPVEDLLELVAGHLEFCRLFVLEDQK